MINLVQNDTKPTFGFILTQDGSAIDLSGATVKFYFKKSGSDELKIDGRECTVTDASNGVGHMDWETGDLDTTGIFYGEIEITFSGGSIQTCINKIKFNIRQQIG